MPQPLIRWAGGKRHLLSRLVPHPGIKGTRQYTLAGVNEWLYHRIHAFCRRLDDRGVSWMLSNTDAPFIMDLFGNHEVAVVPSRQSIAARGTGRGTVKEIIVTNYRPDPASAWRRRVRPGPRRH